MENIRLVQGSDVFTLWDLYKKASEHKGLKFSEGSGSIIQTHTIVTYVLDKKLLDLLAERGIKKQPRSDDVFTLVDENWQEKSVGGFHETEYWNFKTKEGEKHLELEVGLAVTMALVEEDRGIRFYPATRSTLVSPGSGLSHFRMFKTLVESGTKEVLPVVRELAQSEGHIVVSWTDLGLGGIRSFHSVYQEFFGENKAICDLAMQSHGRVFDPDPYQPLSSKKDKMFIAEPAQPRVIKGWKEQLRKYKQSLAVA